MTVRPRRLPSLHMHGQRWATVQELKGGKRPACSAVVIAPSKRQVPRLWEHQSSDVFGLVIQIAGRRHHALRGGLKPAVFTRTKVNMLLVHLSGAAMGLWCRRSLT